MVEEIDEPISDDRLPGTQFDAEEIQKIRVSLGVTDTHAPDRPIVLDDPVIRKPRKRGRGRPRALNPDGSFKYPKDTDFPESGPESDSGPSTTIAPAPLTKRDEKEVSVRLQNILT